MDEIDIQPMQPEDYPDAVTLWRSSRGVVVHLDDVDSEQAIRSFLEQNGGMSFVAREPAAARADGNQTGRRAGRLVGTLLCGTDGRRGYLHHLAVAETHRGRGIARRLVEAACGVLRERGLSRCHVMVISDNTSGREFWRRVGFRPRENILLMSRDLRDSEKKT